MDISSLAASIEMTKETVERRSKVVFSDADMQVPSHPLLGGLEAIQSPVVFGVQVYSRRSCPFIFENNYIKSEFIVLKMIFRVLDYRVDQGLERGPITKAGADGVLGVKYVSTSNDFCTVSMAVEYTSMVGALVMLAQVAQITLECA